MIAKGNEWRVGPLGNLALLSDTQMRSISPENFTGEKSKGAMATEGTGKRSALAAGLGPGWKISPSVVLDPKSTFELASIEGPGAIRHIWLTPTGNVRFAILRIYWDHQEQPSVECPLGDFFASGWGRFSQLSSLAVCVNPRSGCNSYWEMPFRTHCRITLTNLADQEMVLYYQITYALMDVPEQAAYFHAQFRRQNPVPKGSVHTLLDGVSGRGSYVGTYLAWGTNTNGWWGEGELKFYLDGDSTYPTIAYTGTEDYFGGSYNFEDPEKGGYQAFTTPYSGLHQVIRPDGNYRSQMRFGMYRWHITDPIRFQTDLRVTVQALGWHEGRYVLLQDDVASVAFWYQTLPTAPFPELPERSLLEVI